MVPIPTQLLWEVCCNYCVDTIHSHFHPPPPVYSLAWYSFIQLSELGRHGENERAKASKQQQRRFKSGLSRLRVRDSTDEVQRSRAIVFVGIYNLFYSCIAIAIFPSTNHLSLPEIANLRSACYKINPITADYVVQLFRNGQLGAAQSPELPGVEIKPNFPLARGMSSPEKLLVPKKNH